MTYLSPNLAEEIQIPAQGMLSRTLHNDDSVKVILFGFSPGHELSAHTAPVAATLHILRGEALVTLGDRSYELSAGAFAAMPPKLTHAIVARTPLVLLLTMCKRG